MNVEFGKIFFDTNILIYLYSKNEPLKKDIAERLLTNSSNAIISTQVINEFINVLHKKQKVQLEDINQALHELSKYFSIIQISISTIELALKLANIYKYSYFDSLIIASALENNCEIICSEDMHSTHVIENRITIINPFTQNDFPYILTNPKKM